MAVRKEYVGLNPDGSPHFSFISDDPSDVLVVTGPIYGPVVVDGEAIDVTDAVIAVESQAKADAVSDAIGRKHVEQGHPSFLSDPTAPNDGFVHTPNSEKKGR